MSIVLYRRLLALVGAAAILVAAGAVAGLIRARGAATSPLAPEAFRPEVPNRILLPDRLYIGIPLGGLGDDEGGGAPPPPRGWSDTEKELARLGTIVSAIIVYPPYDQIRPALVFRFKEPRNGERYRTIRLGEALVEVKQDTLGELKRPFRFKFIGFERDPKHPDAPLFLFDVDCDGKNIQKLHWIGDEPEKPAAAEGKDEDGKQPAAAVTLFAREKDVNAPTEAGRAYIAKHWKSFAADVRTQPSIDHKTGKHGGVRVLGIKPGSVVRQFRVVADDVIVAINGRPVSHKAETVRVIREELHKKKTHIVVRIRRQGRVVEETFDTRDPATRETANRRNAEVGLDRGANRPG